MKNELTKMRAVPFVRTPFDIFWFFVPFFRGVSSIFSLKYTRARRFGALFRVAIYNWKPLELRKGDKS